jgi:hypothetical protein
MEISRLRVAPIHPAPDQSDDRRTDLMGMALSLCWHRGTASGLPSGAD